MACHGGTFTGRDAGPDSARVPWVLSSALVGQWEGSGVPGSVLCVEQWEGGRRPVKVSHGQTQLPPSPRAGAGGERGAQVLSPSSVEQPRPQWVALW